MVCAADDFAATIPAPPNRRAGVAGAENIVLISRLKSAEAAQLSNRGGFSAFRRSLVREPWWPVSTMRSREDIEGVVK
jgi:hypothetical protein